MFYVKATVHILVVPFQNYKGDLLKQAWLYLYYSIEMAILIERLGCEA
jgi:hypothetical protein